MNYKLAVYIGRFSPFHKGHHQTLLSGFDLAPKVLVLVGSRFPNRSLENPFTFEERKHDDLWILWNIIKRTHNIKVELTIKLS